LAGDASTREHQALAFALEEQLPLAAEDFVAAAVESGSSPLAVAVAVAPIREWIAALESAGIAVQSVAPAALLALQQLNSLSRNFAAGGTPTPQGQAGGTPTPQLGFGIGAKSDHEAGLRVVVWQDGSGLDCFVLANGKPQAWRHFPADAGALVQHLAFLVLTSEGAAHDGVHSLQQENGMNSVLRDDGENGMNSVLLDVTACNVAPELLESMSPFPEITLRSIDDEPLTHAAAKSGASVLKGTLTPFVELRAGPLASADPLRSIAGPLRLASVAAVMFLAAVAGAAFFRAHQYRALAAECHERQTEVFRRALPGQTVPAGIVSRLRSEHGKLTAAKSSPSPVASASATRLLYRVLAGLPRDVRYRLFEIRVEEGRVDLDGEVLSHGDADLIASALRAQELNVELPRSQQLPSQTIGVRLAASLPAGLAAKPTKSR
jgi:type II secretory pathway component PulL